MKTTALLFAVMSLAVGGSAFAAGKVTAADCNTVAKMKADLPKGVKIVPLNIGQMHFMMGAYAATPPVGPPPPADNALLIQMNGKSLIIWMQAECAAKQPPMPIPEKFVAILRKINPVAGEASDAPDDSSQDLKL